MDRIAQLLEGVKLLYGSTIFGLRVNGGSYKELPFDAFDDTLVKAKRLEEIRS